MGIVNFARIALRGRHRRSPEPSASANAAHQDAEIAVGIPSELCNAIAGVRNDESFETDAETSIENPAETVQTKQSEQTKFKGRKYLLPCFKWSLLI